MKDLIEEANALLKVQAQSKRQRPLGECAECDRYRAEGISMFPSHTPSSFCESGKHPHCTCDMCF